MNRMVSSCSRTVPLDCGTAGADQLNNAEVKALSIPPAYIDPGSGSLIIQVVIATVVAAPIVLRNQLRRAGGAIRRALSATRAQRSKE